MTGDTQASPEARQAVVILFILVIAALVRAWGLSDPELWWDELHSLWYVRTSASELIDIKRTSDIHPPLYFLALQEWTSQFGVSREAARSLSVVFSVATLLLAYFALRRLFSAPVALIAIGFVATFPTSVHYGREARMYALLTFWFLLSFFFFAYLYGTSRDPRPHRSAAATVSLTIGFAVSLALAFYTHYSAALFFMLYTLAGVVFLAQGRRKLFVQTWGGLALATVLVSPQMVQLFSSSLGDPRKDWMSPTTWELFINVSLGAYPYPSVLKLLVLVLFVLGFALMLRRHSTEAFLMALFTIGGMVLAAVIGIWEPIYLVRTIQVFTVFSGVFVAFVLLALPRRAAVMLGTGLMVLNLFTVARNDYPVGREDMLVDRIGPLVAMLDPDRDAVFVKDYLPVRRSMIVYGIPLFDIAQPVSLPRFDEDIPRVLAAAQTCMSNDGNCRGFVLIVEAESRFEPDGIAAWNGLADDLKAMTSTALESSLAGFRVIVLSRDPAFLAKAAERLGTREEAA